MSFFSDVERDLVVAARTEVADGVIALDLVSHNGRDLPVWTPGSHVDLILDDGRSPGSERVERQYSLCGDPSDRATWRVAVLRENDGRGGSLLVHDAIQPGQRLRVRGPRSHFAFEPRADAEYRFVAGGIGITPILAMVQAAAAAGVKWTLDYAGRSRSTMAFLDEVAALGAGAGAGSGSGAGAGAGAGSGSGSGPVRLFPADEGERLDVAAVAADADEHTHVFVCGPARLIDAVSEALDGSAAELHVERFEAIEFGEPVWTEPFEVELAMSGTVITVAPEQTILEAIEEQSPETVVLSSCRRGTCGTCEVPVLEGEIDHRDSVLTTLERADSLVMMPCVSRAACARIALDV